MGEQIMTSVSIPNCKFFVNATMHEKVGAGFHNISGAVRGIVVDDKNIKTGFKIQGLANDFLGVFYLVIGRYYD